MRLRPLFVAALIATVSLSAVEPAQRRIFDVRQSGAVADGKTLCTAAIQHAIDACAAAGGGTVLLPPGTYLSGTLMLRSHIALELDSGATLLGSADPKDYPAQPVVLASYTDNYVRQALIYADNVEHVSIRGAGIIDGNGGKFRWKEYRDRPYGIRLVQCRDVTVEGLTLRNSAMWMQHYLGCDRVRIRGLRVFNHASYNNDGLDLDGCHDVVVSDCVIDSDDDAIVLKSTLDRACENVTVTNCVLSSHANAFKLGTESNGGFRNIVFSNSVILSPRYSQPMYGTQRGSSAIAVETVDGGTLENVAVTNVAISGVDVPIFVRLGDRARPFRADGPRPAVGSLRRVVITNVVATGAGRTGCSITGLPGHPVEDVTLSQISLEFDGGGKREWAVKEVAERADAYPASRMFGDLPAYGFYARHVEGLKLTDVRVRTKTDDFRHAIVCDDVRDLEVVGLNCAPAEGAPAVLRWANVRAASVRDVRLLSGAARLLRLEGTATSDVHVQAQLAAVESSADVPRIGWRVVGTDAR